MIDSASTSEIPLDEENQAHQFDPGQRAQEQSLFLVLAIVSKAVLGYGDTEL